MTLDIPFGFAEVSLVFRHDDDSVAYNVTFGIGDVISGPGLATDINGTGFAVAEAWTNNLRDRTSDKIVFERVDVVQATSGGGEPLRGSWPVGNRGQATDEMLPQNCALLVSKHTSIGGRRGKGRFFVPGMLQEAHVNAVGVIDTASLNGFQTVFDAFLDDLKTLGPTMPDTIPVPPESNQAPGLDMFVLHNDPPSGLGPSRVNNILVSNLISTQRRRLR